MAKDDLHTDPFIWYVVHSGYVVLDSSEIGKDILSKAHSDNLKRSRVLNCCNLHLERATSEK